jgi:hypothetical protein
MATCGMDQPLCINAIIYTEVSIGLGRIEALEAALHRGCSIF